ERTASSRSARSGRAFSFASNFSVTRLPLPNLPVGFPLRFGLDLMQTSPPRRKRRKARGAQQRTRQRAVFGAKPGVFRFQLRAQLFQQPRVRRLEQASKPV